MLSKLITLLAIAALALAAPQNIHPPIDVTRDAAPQNIHPPIDAARSLLVARDARKYSTQPLHSD